MSTELATPEGNTDPSELQTHAPAGWESVEKRLEGALRESQRAMTTLLSNVPGMAYRSRNDPEWTMEFVSQGSLSLTGFPPDHLTGNARISYGSIIHPDDREKVWRNVQSALAERQPFELIYRIVTAGGKTKWVWEQGRGIFDDGGAATALEGFVTDITEHKGVEHALRESEERFKTVFDAVRAGIMIVDPETHIIVDANPVAVEMIGAEKDQIVGSICHQFVCPAEKGRCPITDLGQTVDNSERKLLKPGGASTSILKTINSVTLAGKRYLLESFIDIQERKKAEEALRQSEQRYRSLFDGIPVGLFRTSADGRLIDVNQTLVEILGYPSRDALLATNVTDTYASPKARAEWQVAFQREGPVGNFEYQLRRYDGTLIWVEENARVVLNEEGEVLWYEGSMVDISKRKQAEQEMMVLQDQLRQSQKMEAVGQLAGGIAHDFNNLLTVIGGYSELSLLRLRKSDPLREAVEGIQKAANRAADLTRQLLAFSRRQLMEMRVLDLNSLLFDLDKMLHRLIGENIEVKTILAQDLGRVKADPGQIEQAILNLAVNARDAMPSGGKLTLETANVEFDESYAGAHAKMPDGRYVMLSVSDTGEGIRPEIRDRIFEPFFTTKEKGKGTGLGLSTVYGIIKQSAGYVWVYSEPGIGTTFKIYLPSVNEPAEVLREKVVAGELLRGVETILVVEDDDSVRDLTRKTLESQGYRVLEASSGEAALRIYRGSLSPIHMILTDVVMPGLSGKQLVDRLQPMSNGTKVIYMSGYTDNGILSHGVLQKGINYIQKPFTMEGLSRMVRRVLDR